MYAVITPYSRNVIETQDFDVVSRHQDINLAAALYNFRSEKIVEMDDDRAIRVVDDLDSEPDFNPYTLSDLESLCDWMRRDTAHEWPADLPTFGGSDPANTEGVWSWDETRVLVGTCADDLQILDRDDELGWWN